MKTKIKSVSYYRTLDRTGKPEPAAADMLRYDRAFQCPADPSLVAKPIIQINGGVGKKTPTFDRWNSFGQRLDPQALSNDVQLMNDGPTLAGDWITFVHPRDDQGREDYAKLVPQTLDEYLAAKTAEAAKFR